MSRNDLPAFTPRCVTAPAGVALASGHGRDRARCRSPYRPGGASPRRASCFDLMPESWASVMPGRARTRAVCTASGADTTTMWSQSVSSPVSNSSGMSSTATGSLRRPVSARKSRRASATRGWDDRFEPRQRSRIRKHTGAEPLAVDRPVLADARKSGLDGGNGRAAVERVNHGIGIEHRHALVTEHAGRRRFAHADRAGQADDDHRGRNGRRAGGSSAHGREALIRSALPRACLRRAHSQGPGPPSARSSRRRRP